MGQLKQQNQLLQSQIEALKRVNQTENQKVAKNAQAESATQVTTLNQRVIFLEKQAESHTKENLALRQAQKEMQERHYAEV